MTKELENHLLKDLSRIEEYYKQPRGLRCCAVEYLLDGDPVIIPDLYDREADEVVTLLESWGYEARFIVGESSTEGDKSRFTYKGGCHEYE